MILAKKEKKDNIQYWGGYEKIFISSLREYTFYDVLACSVTICLRSLRNERSFVALTLLPGE